MTRTRTETPADPGEGTARRDVLRGAGAVGVGLLAAGVGASSTAGIAGAQTSLEEWLSDVSNYDGSAVDRTGESEVTVRVGTQANGGAYGFGPAAVRVSPGTTVRWEWTGEGGQHNVVAADGGLESDLYSEAGTHFEHTFESEGTVPYACSPHESLGMKGAVLVGERTGPVSEPDYEGWFEGVSNYSSTVDRRGQGTVAVDVGTQANGGAYGFGPAAVRVSPGTTVEWAWTGEGGQHNVIAEDGSFESDLYSEAGTHFEHTFEEPGVYPYVCEPHEPLGMKGAVVVGNVGGGGDGGGGEGADAEGGGGPLIPIVDVPGIAVGLVSFGVLALSAAGLIGAEGYVAARSWYREANDVATSTATEAAPERLERALGHEEYDPVGTAALIVVYLSIVLLMWVFMYFVEFLGNGPTIIG
jgi:halocyanin-like protein